ncbi:hypothetical protein [Arthrospira platensis]
MKLKDELQERRDEILAVAQQHGAFNVRIFGSVAQGGSNGRIVHH